ncbi:MAG: hypothetical protein ACLP9L_14665 [Thermoguttaceae bacterium]
MDFQRALLRIDRFLSSVRKLITATATETTADSQQAYHDAYAAFLEGCRTIEAVADDLEDRGFSGGISPINMDKSTLRAMKPNTIFQDGKLVGGMAFVLVKWLKTLEQALLKAREFCSKKRRKRPAIPIIEEDELILATLADAYPAAVNQPDLERLTGLSHQKISGRLKWLESKKYVKRPEGTKRKGHAITAAGLSAIGQPLESSH